uniref:NADH-ubiquinone oxidoreductase chain 2 n=1 Tax=Rhyzopertha dominica TaxID=92692 RepID=A0A4V1DVF3_RHYDO|nr:NADH dehydrogenase subunit 2 [Rhyzopertha dominica]QCI56356.1 NADH dehydrogenase subunit 2 [Rhyzopertha dominica]
MIKLSKISFTITMMIGSMITISSYTWMGMWMGLEINLLSIIPLLTTKKNIYSTEAAIKYFITQALTSSILLMSILILSTNLINQKSAMMILYSSLMTKMGTAPFHFWFPEIIEGLDWMNCLIMMTWQKIAPAMILMSSMNMNTFIYITITSSMLISGIMGVNQTSLRKIMAYSSINHMAWMMASMNNEKIFYIYLSIYITMSSIFIFTLKSNNSLYIYQMMTSNQSPIIKKTFIINLLSMGGLPPLLGFFPKWMVINSMIQSNDLILSTFMVMTTLLTLYFYMQISMPILTMYKMKMKWSKKNPQQFFMNKMNMINLLSIPVCTIWFNFY